MTPTLLTSRIRAGVWEALLSSPAATPKLCVTLLGADVPGLELRAMDGPGGDGRYALRLAIPSGVLSDGVQTFVVSDADTGDSVGHFTIICGASEDEDLRAEIDLIRAELDMLKRAFRRHCVDTGR